MLEVLHVTSPDCLRLDGRCELFIVAERTGALTANLLVCSSKQFLDGSGMTPALALTTTTFLPAGATMSTLQSTGALMLSVRLSKVNAPPACELESVIVRGHTASGAWR